MRGVKCKICVKYIQQTCKTCPMSGNTAPHQTNKTSLYLIKRGSLPKITLKKYYFLDYYLITS